MHICILLGGLVGQPELLFGLAIVRLARPIGPLAHWPIGPIQAHVCVLDIYVR